MLRQRLKSEWKEFTVLMRSVPAAMTVLFVVSVFAMNLLANKSIDLPVYWLALDAGIIISWAAFLAMDVITKHFGPKAANEITVVAVLFNLLFCVLFFAASKIPGSWSEAAVDGAGEALDRTFGGTWYVVLGSTVAFTASAIINNTCNFAVGKLFKKRPDGPLAFILRSYISTAIAQFADNLIFAFIVSHFFFGWSAVQCVTCALTGMIAELLCEAAFSFLGYKICADWKRNGVGEKYFELKNGGAIE